MLAWIQSCRLLTDQLPSHTLLVFSSVNHFNATTTSKVLWLRYLFLMFSRMIYIPVRSFKLKRLNWVSGERQVGQCHNTCVS